MKGENLGEFERLVMLAVVGLAEKAYGVSIRKGIEKKTSRSVSFGSVYAALERLERKGFVRSRVGEATPERGGRAKRYYDVTDKGLRAIKASDEDYMAMRESVVRRPAWGH